MLFDTHCHLGSPEWLSESATLMSRAYQGGVGALCLISTNWETIQTSEALSRHSGEALPQLFWSAGLHPHEAKDDSPEFRSKLETAARRAHAIGETGLDFHYNFSERKVQHESLDFHIELACQLQKPLVLHCREAATELVAQLKAHGALQSHPRPGIFHCFSENKQVAEDALDLGFMISFSGILTFRNADSLREIAKWIPKERILIETDAPFLAPHPHRGKRNEPAFLNSTFAVLSGLRSDLEKPELEKQLWENSLRTFGALS
jgi:TatD DNase family protein